MAFGFLKKIAKGAGKVLGGVGDVVSKAAPLAGLIPGVGTLAGGIIGGAGGSKSDFRNVFFVVTRHLLDQFGRLPKTEDKHSRGHWIERTSVPDFLHSKFISEFSNNIK